jgi:hypothetical protein
MRRARHVAADIGREAALLEKPLEGSESIVFTGGGESFAASKRWLGRTEFLISND